MLYIQYHEPKRLKKNTVSPAPITRNIGSVMLWQKANNFYEKFIKIYDVTGLSAEPRLNIRDAQNSFMCDNSAKTRASYRQAGENNSKLIHSVETI